MEKSHYISEQGRIDNERIQSGEATINEIRKEHGLPPIEEGGRHLTIAQCDIGMEPGC